jgi:hypothetical protein
MTLSMVMDVGTGKEGGPSFAWTQDKKPPLRGKGLARGEGGEEMFG